MKNNCIKKTNFCQKLCLSLLLYLTAFTLTGCGSSEVYTYHISYVDSAQTQTVQVGYEPSASSKEALVEEFLKMLATDTDTVEYVKAIPEGVQVMDWNISQDCLTLDFNNTYSQLDSITEILCRLAIVRTMTQIDGIDSVLFEVKGEPLEDGKGNMVGRMTTDSFVENPGEQINSFQNATINLYFSNETGDGLVLETQDVHYNSNVSLEKLVLEHLMSGPKSEGAKKTIPDETKLINVSVADNNCYVNFDESFFNQNYEIQEAVVIYSIVDSLASLGHIRRVQISVNGDTSGKYRDNFKLSEMYFPDYSYVNLEDASSVIVNDIEGDTKTGE